MTKFCLTSTDWVNKLTWKELWVKEGGAIEPLQWHFKGVKQSAGSFPSNLCWRDVSDHGNKPQNTRFGQILFEIVTHYAVLEGSYLCRQFLVLKRSHVFSCTYTHLCDRDDLYSALKLPSLSTSFSFILFPLVFFLISPDICRNTASDLVAALMKKENWCVCVCVCPERKT